MRIKDFKLIKREIPGFLYDRFGDHFAQISTEQTLKLRSSVKDVARVMLGSVPFEIEELTRKFVLPPMGVTDRDHVFGYDTDEGHVTGAIDYDPALREFIEKYPDLFPVVKMVLSLRKTFGRHASGWCIANRPVQEFIPTVNIGGVRCTQYTANSVEKSGAIKYDFLTVNALNDISEALKLVQTSSGMQIPDFIIKDGVKVPGNRLIPINGNLYDIWELPQDPEVYKDIAEGRTETVFQLSTNGAVDWLKYFNYNKVDGTPILNSIHDLAIFTALDRPGPLDAFVETEDSKHNMLVEYTRRARGMKGAKLPQVFEDLLKKTYSVLVTQEQVQELYQIITGCSVTEAEKFRNNVSKKKKIEIQKSYSVFMKAATEKYGQEEAQACWDAIVTFSAYGFNYSHGISYVTTAYACAYLKHHFPLQWWCAVLSNATKNEVNENFWEYCGDLIDLPDIRYSQDNYAVRDGRIIAPISLMNGIGPAAHEQICKYVPYIDIMDFCKKIQQHKELGSSTSEVIKVKKDKKTGGEIKVVQIKKKLGTSAINRRVVTSLIVAGVMDSLFKGDLSIIEKMAEFERCLAEVSDSKPEPVSEELNNIDDLAKFQLQKTILPGLSRPLLPLLEGRYGIKRLASGIVLERGGDQFRFWTNNSIRSLENKQNFERQVTGVIAAYVVSTRVFSYSGGTKTACSVNFDLDGVRYEWVKWPDRFGNLDEKYNSKLDNSIVLLYCKKYKKDKPPTIEDVQILSPKIDLVKKEKE